MKIILMRHGEAENDTRPDSARQLTDYGHQQAAQTAAYIAEHYAVDLFVVSPYKRAQQTLAQLQSLLSAVPTTVSDNITPSDEAKVALAQLATMDAECMVVVCHMSLVAHFASLLTNDMPESFALAEARVFDMAFVMSGMANEVDRFVPSQPL